MHKRAGKAALKAVTFATEMLRSREETVRRDALLEKIVALPAAPAPAYLVAGIFYTLAHPTLLWRIMLYASMAGTVVLIGTLAVWLGVLYPQAVALHQTMGAALAWVVSFVLCLAYTVLVVMLVYAVFMPCCEEMLFTTTFSLRNQAVPSSGTFKPIIHNMQSTVIVLLWAFVTLPINFIPVIGQIAWVVLNGLPSGWESHSDYFSKKGLGFSHQRRAIWAHRWEYWTYGMGKLGLFMIPFVNILFMFTVVVSSALWAVDYEKRLAEVDGDGDHGKSYGSIGTKSHSR